MNQIVTKDVFLKIESFGDRYIKEELVPWDKTKLTADWWYALLFFFGRSFYQGRRDSVSSQIKRTAVEALEDDILGKDIHEKERKLKLHLGSGDLDWKKMQSSTNLLQKALLKERPMQLDNGRTKELRVGKEADRLMVISALRKIALISDHNLVNYSLSLLGESGGIQKLYDGLLGQKEQIYSVGDKIATLWIRDIVSLYGLESTLTETELAKLEPIDTWVRRMAVRLAISNNNSDDSEIQQKIVATCKANGVSPSKFNMGAWYMSTNALDLLLESMGIAERRAVIVS